MNTHFSIATMLYMILLLVSYVCTLSEAMMATNNFIHIERTPRFVLVWSTDQNQLKDRQYAVLDSIYYHHPSAQVSIYVKDDKDNRCVTRYIQEGYSVELRRLDITSMRNIAPMESSAALSWANNWNRNVESEYFYSHLSDFIRFCHLYIYGGTYLDFDAVLLQPFSTYRNAIGIDNAVNKCDWCLDEDNNYLAPGVLINFSPRNPVLLKALEAFATEKYDPHCFNCVGPKSITTAAKLDLASVTMLPSHILYPVRWDNIKVSIVSSLYMLCIVTAFV